MEELQKEITAVAKFISDKIENEKFDYKLKMKAHNKRVVNALDRLTELADAWKKNVDELRPDQYATAGVARGEAMITGLEAATKIIRETIYT